MGRSSHGAAHFAGTRARARAFRGVIIARVRAGFDRAIRAAIGRLVMLFAVGDIERAPKVRAFANRCQRGALSGGAGSRKMLARCGDSMVTSRSRPLTAASAKSGARIATTNSATYSTSYSMASPTQRRTDNNSQSRPKAPSGHSSPAATTRRPSTAGPQTTPSPPASCTVPQRSIRNDDTPLDVRQRSALHGRVHRGYGPRTYERASPIKRARRQCPTRATWTFIHRNSRRRPGTPTHWSAQRRRPTTGTITERLAAAPGCTSNDSRPCRRA